MISEDQFRFDFPEFADTAKFASATFSFWANVAQLTLNQCRWGRSAVDSWPSPIPTVPVVKTLYDVGCELLIAHNMALEAKALSEAASGGIPGMSTGPISSKSVDKVSVSFDTNGGLELNGGHWNLTIYGTRFLRMLRLVGAGPLHIGVGPLGGPVAWPGPMPGPW